MVINMKRISTSSLLLLSMFFSLVAFAQPNQTLTNFYSVPQSTLLNPGLRPDAKLTIGIPGLTSIHSHVSNQIFDLSMFDKDKDFQTEFEGQVDELTESNFLQSNVDYDLLFVGIALSPQSYISFGASYRATAVATLAPDLMKFLVYGNGSYVGETLDWSPTQGTGHHYAFYHVGYNHTLLDGALSVGARVKLISGMGSLQTDIDQLSVLTQTSFPEPYTVSLSAGGRINTAGIPRDGLTAGDVIRDGYDFQNFGVGFDFGFRYQVSDKWSVTGSVNDLGSINWKEGTENYVVENQTIEISGITYELFSDDSGDFGDAVSSYFDSIGELLDPDTLFDSFSTPLNRKINIGVQWRFHEKHELGVQFYNEDAFGVNINALGISWYGDLADWFQIKAQYTAYNSGFDNFGAGFALGRAFQWHFMADYLHGIPNIATWNEFNFRTGFSINLNGNKQTASVPTESPIEAPVQESTP